MKIKHILSFAILLSILFFDLQLALANGESPTPVADEIVSCQSGQILIVDTNNQSTCTDGTAYCEAKKMKYDQNTKTCYLSEQGTILPFTNLTVAQCNQVFDDMSSNSEGVGKYKKLLSGEIEAPFSLDVVSPTDPKATVSASITEYSILGCGIKTGKMKLWMIPYYVKYLLQFVLSVAGIVAVGAMVFGGYLYMFGTVMDDKEKGKRSVMYGIMGFVVVLLAWAIVNVVISLATM